IPALKEAALGDHDELAARMASHAIAFMDDPAAKEALWAIVRAKKDWGAEINARWGLCKFGDEAAVGDALAYLKDGSVPRGRRLPLGSSLVVLHDPALMPLVDETVRLLRTDQKTAASLSLAVDYYSNVGTAEARQRLQALANDAGLSEALRQTARAAL